MSKLDDDLAAMLNQGSTSKFPKKADQKFTPSEKLKKMFIPRFDKGQTSAQFRVRILRNPEGGSPLKEVKFHQVKVGPTWQKILCLEELGQECPLCDTAAGFLAEGDKESAKPWRASSFYVVRVLDRAKENEGVKFWRFKKNFKGQGEFDKLSAVINLGFNILDPSEKGFDIIIQCGQNDRGNSVVTNIACVKPSALADSQEKIDSLINDDSKWQDVFTPKELSYLEDVVKGKAQYWDDSLKKYVKPGEDQDATLTPKKEEAPKLKDNPLMKDEKPVAKVSEDNILASDDDDDDENLPF